MEHGSAEELLQFASSNKTIEDDVVSYWRERMDNPTIREIFEEWNARRLELGKISGSSYARYKRDFERYYERMGERRIRTVEPDEIEEFLEEQLVCVQP